jgi:putative hydrolase of the HAD superfamily
MSQIAPITSATDQTRQYQALLLDFGSVIQKSFFETRREFETLLELPTGALTWAGPFDPASDALWRQMLAGQLSERDYWNTRACDTGALIGESWSIQSLCRAHNRLPHATTLRREVLALIADVKQAGLKFGILSNELELFHGAGWLQTMPFADDVDAVVDATLTQILKPDPRAYQLALQRLGLRADQVIFIDDQPRNVEGGRAAGIRSLHLDVVKPGECIAEARVLLGIQASVESIITKGGN